MHPVYPIVFSCFAVAAAVRTFRMVASIGKKSVDSIIDFYSMIGMTPRYYIGIKTTSIVFDPNMHVDTILYMWAETGEINHHNAVVLLGYLKKQMPELAKTMFIHRMHPFNNPTSKSVKMGRMDSTPGVSLRTTIKLSTIAAMLDAGRLLRERFGKKINWKNY